MTLAGVQTPAVVPEPAKTQLLVLQSEFCQQGPVALGLWQVGAPTGGLAPRGPFGPSQTRVTLWEVHWPGPPQAVPTWMFEGGG